MKQVLFIAFISIVLSACSSKQQKAEKEKTPAVMVEMNLKVEGMSCTECEQSIAKGVNELAGIDSISANHLDSTAFVRFDASQTDLSKISKAIEGRGYHVAGEIKNIN